MLSFCSSIRIISEGEIHGCSFLISVKTMPEKIFCRRFICRLLASPPCMGTTLSWWGGLCFQWEQTKGVPAFLLFSHLLFPLPLHSFLLLPFLPLFQAPYDPGCCGAFLQTTHSWHLLWDRHPSRSWFVFFESFNNYFTDISKSLVSNIPESRDSYQKYLPAPVPFFIFFSNLNNVSWS